MKSSLLLFHNAAIGITAPLSPNHNPAEFAQNAINCAVPEISDVVRHVG